MSIHNGLTALALLIMFASTARAAGAESIFGLGARLGPTTGVGLEASYGLNRWIDLRAAVNVGDIEFDYEEQETTYRGELSYSAVSGFIDIKPFGGGFRLTAGWYSQPMELELNASGQDTYDLGDRSYAGDLNLAGDVDLGSSAPYLGIGWGGTTNGRGFGASFDLGVQFGDSPEVSLIAGGRVCDATQDPGCSPNGADSFDVNDPNDQRALAFQAELNREIAELEEDAEDFELIPVIQFGLHYRFGGSRATPPDSGRCSSPACKGLAPTQTIVATSAPAAARTPASAPSVTTRTPPAGSFMATRPLNIKPSPTTASKPTGVIAVGATVTVKGEQKNNDGDWRFVTSGVLGGWVRAADLNR